MFCRSSSRSPPTPTSSVSTPDISQDPSEESLAASVQKVFVNHSNSRVDSAGNTSITSAFPPNQPNGMSPSPSHMHRIRRKNIFAESSLVESADDDNAVWTDIVPKDPETHSFLVNTLKDCYLFESLDSDKVSEIVDVMKQKNIAANEVLFKEGDRGDYFYFVGKGRLKLLKYHKKEEIIHPSKDQKGNHFLYNVNQEPEDENDNNSEQNGKLNILIRSYKPGEWFGELGLLHEAPRAATMVAETACTLWMLDRMTFKHACTSTWEMNRNTTWKVLREVPLLRVLQDDQLKDVAQVARIEEYTKGKEILRAGDPAEAFYIVKKGIVKCVSKNGELLQLFKKFDFFGDLELFQEDQSRIATCSALEDTDVTVIVIDKSSFISIFGPIRQVVDDNIRALALQEVKIFRDLSVDQRIKAFKLFKSEEFKVGDVIIREGDQANDFFVIRSGIVRVTKEMDGTSELVKDLTVGEFFGEMALLYDEPRNATVTCVTDTLCFVMNKVDFRELMDFAESTTQQLLDRATQRQWDNTQKLEDIVRRKREQEIRNLLQQVNRNAVVNSSSVASLQVDNYQQQGLLPSHVVNQQLHDPDQLTDLLSNGYPRNTNYHLSELRPICTLGTGTFGRVKSVLHAPTNQVFALKIQSKYQIMKYKLRTNIFNERNILKRIRHPLIVTLHQTFQDVDSLYMLLEIIPGGELFSLLQNFGSRLETKHHMFYVSCVVSAFEALHFINVLYRDLKPENLMIDCLGYLKLVDFGFAKEVERSTYTLCGTPEYFSPELVLGKGYGKGNDIWAIGILAYELIAGYTPFGSNQDSQSEIYKNIVRNDLLFPHDCRDMQGMQLIARLLDKNAPTRLGCDRTGMEAVKNHPWFYDMDWDALFQQRIEAPWVPQLVNPLDSRHFDRYDENYRVLPFRYDGEDPFADF